MDRKDIISVVGFVVAVVGFFLLLIGLVAIFSNPVSSRVARAEAVDWVWGVEELESGAARIWLRYDDIAGYCTADPQLTNLAKDAAGERVKITFESVRWRSEEDKRATGCSRLMTGSESSTPIFKLTGIEILGGEE